MPIISIYIGIRHKKMKNVLHDVSNYLILKKEEEHLIGNVHFQTKRAVVSLEKDIPFLESVGFTPKTADCFYALDIVRFFKEKTIGKSEATVRKYQNSLFDLRELLEQSAKKSWEQCDESFWMQLILNDYLELYDYVSKTRRKNFLSTISTFLTWLDMVKHTSHYHDIV